MNSSRNLLNLVLLIIVVLLVALVAFEPGHKQQENNPRLLQLEAKDVQHILIQRDTGEDIELKKIDNRWQMIRPYPLPASDFRMESLLRLLSTDSLAQYDLNQLEPGKYGLDKPRATITFNDKVRVVFGNNEPLQQQRYIKTGNTLHLITDTFYYQLAAHEMTFVDHHLLAGTADIEKLELPSVSLSQQGGKWHAIPANDTVSADAISDLLDQWRNIQATDLRKVKTSSAEKTVTLHFKEQEKPVVFHIQQNDKKPMLVRNDIGIGFIISQPQLEKLLTLPATKNVE